MVLELSGRLVLAEVSVRRYITNNETGDGDTQEGAKVIEVVTHLVGSF